MDNHHPSQLPYKHKYRCYIVHVVVPTQIPKIMYPALSVQQKCISTGSDCMLLSFNAFLNEYIHLHISTDSHTHMHTHTPSHTHTHTHTHTPPQPRTKGTSQPAHNTSNVVSEQGDSVVMSEYPSVEGGGGRGARTGETETRT